MTGSTTTPGGDRVTILVPIRNKNSENPNNFVVLSVEHGCCRYERRCSFSAPFREGDVVSKKLESEHVRPVGSELRTRLRDRVGGTALTDLYATGTCIHQSRSRLPLGRDRESAPERGDITDMSALRRDDKRAWLRLSTVCGPKEGRRHQTSCEPEGSQVSCPTGALPDGRHTHPEGHSTPRGLDDKGRSERRLFSIPVSSHDRKFLRFCWQGKMYQFNCLPFGLSSAPWIFTKATKPVVTSLRTLGMRIIIYIDDILVMAPSKELTQEHIQCLIFLLENLGFTVNRQKSLTNPAQEIDFLGLVADSVLMELRLPGSKIKNRTQELPVAVNFGLRKKKLTCACIGLLGGRGL